MIALDEVTDYIFNKLEPTSSFYTKTHKNPKKTILSLPSDYINIIAINIFIAKMKGIIRKSESSELEVEGPFYKEDSCEWIVTTFHN